MAEALPEYPDSDFSDDNLSPVDISFNKAAEHVRTITGKLNNDQLLELYGLYKQATEGRCDTPKPGWFNAQGRKKWEAWRNMGDMPDEEAKEQYTALVQQYDPNWANSLSSGTGDVEKDNWVAVSKLRRSPEPEYIHKVLTLIDAARENCPEQVTMLLSHDSDLRYDKDSDGLTPLHWAADRDAVKSLEAAIAGGCPIDAKDNSGQTALHYAVSCGHIDATKVLVNAGAKLLEDGDGQTPLDLAENDEIRQILEGARVI